MRVIQETLRRLEPSVKVIRRVSYREGFRPLIHNISGQVEPFEVRTKTLLLNFELNGYL